MSIFVGNLPFRAEREDVIQLFAPFGEVLNCSLPLERDTGRKRGFAFIEMADEAIEITAIEGLQGSELMGRPLRINKAEPRGSGGSRRGGRGGYSGGNNNSSYGGYGGNNNAYGGNNNASYGGYGGNNNNAYGGNNNSSYGGYGESSSSSINKPSGAEGWEDRSYGNSSENSEYESGRSRRKRGVSTEKTIPSEEN